MMRSPPAGAHELELDEEVDVLSPGPVPLLSVVLRPSAATVLGSPMRHPATSPRVAHRTQLDPEDGDQDQSLDTSRLTKSKMQSDRATSADRQNTDLPCTHLPQNPCSSTSTSGEQFDICSVPEQQPASTTPNIALSSIPACTAGPMHAGFKLSQVVQSNNRLKRKLSHTMRSSASPWQGGQMAQQGIPSHEMLKVGEESSATQAPLPLQTAASDAATDHTFQEIWGAPAERRVGQPIGDAVRTVVGMEQQARYQAFLKDRQQRNTHHPKGTSKAMQGIFSLMLSFESITNPALQRQLLQHSLDLLQLSRESAVQLLSHEAESAGKLMGLLREYAPVCPQDNHLLMLQGPLHDLEPRQVAAVRNPAVRMKCDHQTDKAWLRGWEQRTNASTADFCDTGGAAELAVKALFPCMQGWAHALQMAWSLRSEEPLEYSCVVEALMAAWVKGDLPSPAAQASVPYAHQVDLSKWESALGPAQVGAGPSLHATPSAPLPCHRAGPKGESIIAAGFPYTPHEWSSASATGLACVDDGCGASMAHCHQAHQPATNLTGVSCGLAILSSLFTRTNFHVEDALLGAYNIMTYGAPKIWYVVPAASAARFEAALEQQHGPNALAALTAKHLYCSLPLPLLKELGVKRFLQMPGYAVLTYPGSVYHWTISTGFSLAEATNLYVGQPGQLLSHLQDWYTLLCSACTQAVKEDNDNVVASLLGRVSISQAVVQVLLEGPLSQAKGSALHCKAVAALKQLQTLQNFMDDWLY
ncbi:hypothetical protein WJX79_009578 [Trebouxia sp. C0005]